MKKVYLIILILILSIITSSCNKKEEYIRLRIIANSNTEIDICDKTIIKNTINKLFDENELTYETINTNNLNNLLKNNLNKDLYNKIVIKECISYYPAKSYKGKFISSGNYQTLLIEIGEAKGNNFWTLLYPEYFGYEFEESNEIEYRSYFYDLLS
ncbi:MAG: stage II sporulation protein R [Bacilli bacterium]|nr:stage II sporulation protein R [Bacilli bacterium]